MIGLCSGSMEGFLHSYIQSSLDDGVSLHGDIAPRIPLDQQRRLDAPHLGPHTLILGGGNLGKFQHNVESLG